MWRVRKLWARFVHVLAFEPPPPRVVVEAIHTSEGPHVAIRVKRRFRVSSLLVSPPAARTLAKGIMEAADIARDATRGGRRWQRNQRTAKPTGAN